MRLPKPFPSPVARGFAALLLGALGLPGVVGCGHDPAAPANGQTASEPADDDHDHDHGHGHKHAEPTNFPEAIASVEEINHEIEEAFVSGDNDEADVALHEAFGAVAAVTKFAPAEHADEIKAAAEELLTAYDYLHGIHSGKDVDYGEVKGDVESAIAKLTAFSPDHDDDHNHGDDGEGA